MIEYKGIHLNGSNHLDFLIDQQVIFELKAVDVLLPIHEAQLITYLKLTGCKTGLLIHFNVPVKKMGIKRMVL